MEIGAENKNKLILACVLGLLAVLALGRLVFSLWGSTPAAAAPSPHVTPAPVASAPRVTTPKKNTRMQASLDPTLRFDWLKASEDMKYEGKGRNIFRAEAEPIPQPVAPAVVQQQPVPQQVVNPGPPIPPPINLKFYGFAAPRNGVKKVFLSEGEDIFIAGEGDIIDRRYKILRIMPMAVEIEDVLNNNRQQIPLTQG